MAKKIKVVFVSASIILLLGVASPSFANFHYQIFFDFGSSVNSMELGSLDDVDFKDRDGEFKPDGFDTGATSGFSFYLPLQTEVSFYSILFCDHSGFLFEGYETFEQGHENYVEVDNILTGYRCYCRDLYVGGSVAFISQATFVNPDGVYHLDVKRLPFALTLGYSYRFLSGLTLGVHYINILPTDYEFSNPSRPDIENLSVSTIGATFGFSF